MNEQQEIEIVKTEIMTLILKVIELEAHGTDENSDYYIPPSDDAQLILNEINEKLQYYLSS